MLPQLPPLELQRCHRYENDVGLLFHEPLAAVSVSPARSVPEMVGGDVFTGAAFEAPCAAPPASSATAETTAASFHMLRVLPLQRVPMQVHTECLRDNPGDD